MIEEATVVSGAASAGQPSGNSDSAALVEKKWQMPSPASLAVGAFLLVASSIAFWSLYSYFWERWNQSHSEFGYGYFVPPTVAFLIWAKRKNLALETVRTGHWASLVVIALAVGVQCVGLKANANFVQSFAFSVLLLAVPYYVWGGGVFRHLWGPLAYMYTMIPWPGQITSRILVPMQSISTSMASAILKTFGTHVWVDGTTVHTSNYAFEVAAACSGLTILFPVVSIAILTAMMVHGSLWRKGLLIVSALPISIVSNSFRIALIGMIGDGGGTELAEKLHDSSGIVGVIIATLLLTMVGGALRVNQYHADYMPAWAMEPPPDEKKTDGQPDEEVNASEVKSDDK